MPRPKFYFFRIAPIVIATSLRDDLWRDGNRANDTCADLTFADNTCSDNAGADNSSANNTRAISF